MAMETAKCPKCGKDARRTGMTLESGQLTIPPAKMSPMSPLTGIRPRSPSASARLTKHMACGTCGHAFKVRLS